MEPLKTLVDALVAGAASYGTAATPATVKGAYEAFKQKLLARFPADPGVFNAVQTAKMKPTAPQTRAMLEQELQTAGVDKDAELVKQAQAVLDLLKQHGILNPSIL
jgi:hypothetical protein